MIRIHSNLKTCNCSATNFIFPIWGGLSNCCILAQFYTPMDSSTNCKTGWRERSAQRKARICSSKIITGIDLNDAKDTIFQNTSDESMPKRTHLLSFRANRQMRAQQARPSPLPSPRVDVDKYDCLSFDNDSANSQALDWGQGPICDLPKPSLEIWRADQNLNEKGLDCRTSSLEIRRADQILSDKGLDCRMSSSFSDAGCASEASTRRVRFSSTVTIKSNVLEVRPLNDEGPMKVPPFGSPSGPSPSVAARLARALSRNFQCIMPSPTSVH